MATAALNAETEKLLRQAARATDKQEVSPLDVATSRILAVRAVVQEMRLLREQFFLGVGFTAGTGAVDPPENLSAQAFASAQTEDPKQIAAADRGAMRMLCLEMAELFQRLFVQGGLAKMINMLEFFNGSFVEKSSATLVSDGATVTMSLEKVGGGDLTMVFSDGETILDCTPPVTIVLTPGTAGVPQVNYVYILQSTKVLTLSTTGWPAAGVEHNRIAFLFIRTAALVQSGSDDDDAALINHNHNDYASDEGNQGHMLHIAEAVREQGTGAKWKSGCLTSVTVDVAESPDALWVDVTAGTVRQLHEHAFAAKNSDPAAAGDLIHIVNHFTTPYVEISGLHEITQDSTGTAIGANKYFTVHVWLVANKEGTHQSIMVNVPSGTYNTLLGAQEDLSRFNNVGIPDEFLIVSPTGFLVASFILKNTTDMTVEDSDDLRGQTPATVGGGGGFGDVIGPELSIDNALARFNLATGKLIQASGMILSDDASPHVLEPADNADDATFRGGTSGVTNFGRDGNTEFAAATLRVVGPAFDEKIDIGEATTPKRVNEVHAVSFIPKSRVAWTLTGTPALDRTKAWSDGSVTNAEFCSLISDLINAGVL